jgi:hypothetical protein
MAEKRDLRLLWTDGLTMGDDGSNGSVNGGKGMGVEKEARTQCSSRQSGCQVLTLGPICLFGDWSSRSLAVSSLP